MVTQSSSRIWENAPNPASSPVNSLNHDHVKSAQLPSIACLTQDLPSRANVPSSPSYPSTNRTSDPWGSQTQSTRSSAYSSGFNGYASSVTSPQRASNTSQFGTTSYPADFSSPTSAGAQPSPGFAPPQHTLGLPHINQQHQNHTQFRDSQHSDSFPPQESRRSSLGSQVNTGFNNLQLNGAGSPYSTHPNPSKTSIAASLQRERGIPQARNSGTSSIHHSQIPTSSAGPQPGETRQQYQSRTAPSITNNPMREVYNAERPTVGQPYAFPDPDMSGHSDDSQEPTGPTGLSRRNSGHTSITSSIMTTDSKMPPGQISLDENPLPDMPGTHHHSLQHKRVSGLSGDGDSPDGSTPYSRTPALRASHKMAERKRRTEMKHLFDQLRSQIPASHGSKSSKWEILSKASDHIKNLEGAVNSEQNSRARFQDIQAQAQQQAHENEILRHEMESLRRQMEEMNRRPGTAGTIHSQPPNYGFANGPGQPQPMQIDPSRSLPPLTNGVQAGSSMQGVQYTDDHRR